MTKLTGKALSARAAELDIEGRSKMSADELRAAVANAETVTETIPEYEETESQDEAERETFTTVLNRSDKRAIRRSRHRRNDGSPRGGVVATGPRAGSFEASVKAGSLAKGYGSRKRNAAVPGFDVSADSEKVTYSPRSVPVNVIHDGH